MKTAIVIGGGIAGCSTAYFLAQRGIAVTLLERHNDIAQEASGNPLAMLYPKFGAKPSLQTAITTHGFHFTLALLQQLPIHQQFFNACGLIQLAFNAAEKVKQDTLRQAEYLEPNKLLFQFVDILQASELAGVALKTEGIFLPQSGWVNPRLLCAALSNHALITIQTSTKALSIEHGKNGWRVECDDRAIEAENVVICNANDMKQFGFCHSAKLAAVRGQIEFLPPNDTSKHLKTIVCSDHYLSPAINGCHSLGTTYSINHTPNDFSVKISADDTQSNLSALEKISPDIFNQTDSIIVNSRASWRSQTLDYRPLAGQLLDEAKLTEKPPRYNVDPASLPWLPGLYVNAGHGSKGMITAPLCGQLIASLIAKTELPIDAKLASSMNPSRFLLRELGLKQLAASLYK